MIITAHSGCDNTPENSLEFVKYAIENNADIIEIDVRSVNDCLVISHDKPTGEAPQLSAVFELVKTHPGVKLNCDLKQNDIEMAVYNLAMQYDLSGQLVFSGSVNPLNLNDAMKNYIEVHFNIEQAVDDVQKKFSEIPNFDATCAEIMSTACRNNNFRVVNAHYRLVTPLFVSTLKKNGIDVNCWTVDDIALAKTLYNMGVRSLTTRKLKEMRSEF